MNPSESTISSAINELKKSPGVFQRLVERYAQVMYPQRFEKLIPKGRNQNDVAIKGWPDAFAIMADGRLDAIEATHSASWRKHIEDDLKKIATLGPTRLGGFLFVAWAPTPSVEIVQKYYDRFAALGITTENITLVFQQQLVRNIRQPRFASAWNDLLNLRIDCYPFQPITLARIFGEGNRVNAFAPTRDEYLNGRVYRPVVASDVEKRLENEGWALVRGLGAAGKTVLAVHIAVGNRYSGNPAYYLDLTTFGPDIASSHISETLKSVARQADDSVLFIVDNIHFNEDFARKVYDYWQIFGNGSRLLMLGRWLSVGSNIRGLARPFDSLESKEILLKVGIDDLAGVFLRLANRLLSTMDDSLRPPEDVLQGWHKIFGGDLIAFSAAVARRIQRLICRDWELRGEDSAHYIRETYLEPITTEEKQNLLLVAALSMLEIKIPEEAVGPGGLKYSIKTGIVHQLELGQENRIHFQLIHPGLGELLLTAAGFSLNDMQILFDVTQKSPSTGAAIVIRLNNLKRQSEADELLKGIIQSPNGIRVVMSPNLNYFRYISKRLIKLNLFSEHQLDNCISDQNATLQAAALNTSLGTLAAILGYSQKTLPKTHACIVSAINQPESRKELITTALNTSLGELTAFLVYASDNLPPLIHDEIGAALMRPHQVQKLITMAPETHLHTLARFLKHANRSLPKLISNGITIALENPDNFTMLAKTAMLGPFQSIPIFLRYAEYNLPKAYASIVSFLLQTENLHKLSVEAMHVKPFELATFLEYTENKIPTLSNALIKNLMNPDILRELAYVTCNTPLNGLLKLLRLPSIAPAIVSAIDNNTWEKAREPGELNQPGCIPAFARLVEQMGRQELAIAPACSLIRQAEARRWHEPQITLQHLTYTLRLGCAAEREASYHFVDVVVTESWLDTQYVQASAGAIAGALLALWGYQDEQVIKHFRTEALRSRLIAEVKKIDAIGIMELSAALQLLGTCALIGLALDGVSILWPGNNRIHELLNLFVSQGDSENIGHIQIQLWVGLHEMARLRTDNISVLPEIGNQVLAFWRNAKAHTDQQRLLNSIMIRWLDYSSRTDWSLVREKLFDNEGPGSALDSG